MSKRLITDRDVQLGSCGARIVLDGETLITPSARDRALRLGIAIVEDGAAPAAQAAQGTGCARCGTAGCSGNCATCNAGAGNSPFAGLPDGLYLVRIEGGRAVSTLPAAGPGLMPRAHSSHDSRS